jgi:hypothetical protein
MSEALATQNEGLEGITGEDLSSKVIDEELSGDDFSAKDNKRNSCISSTILKYERESGLYFDTDLFLYGLFVCIYSYMLVYFL